MSQCSITVATHDATHVSEVFNLSFKYAVLPAAYEKPSTKRPAGNFNYFDTLLNVLNWGAVIFGDALKIHVGHAIAME